MAHKKGVGSSRNGRDSQPKFQGIKKFGGEIDREGVITQTITVKVSGKPAFTAAAA